VKGLNMGSILKLGAIAVAFYLIWRAGIFDKLGVTIPFLGPAPSPTGGGGVTALPATNGSMPTTPNTTGGGGTSTTPNQQGSVQYTQAQIDDMTVRAAGGDMAVAAVLSGLGIRYNGHQWNYYRMQNAGKEAAPATAGLDDSYTATEYLAYRAGLGLSGVTSLGGIPLGVLRGY
jgi:hypothetical protein